MHLSTGWALRSCKNRAHKVHSCRGSPACAPVFLHGCPRSSLLSCYLCIPQTTLPIRGVPRAACTAPSTLLQCHLPAPLLLPHRGLCLLCAFPRLSSSPPATARTFSGIAPVFLHHHVLLLSSKANQPAREQTDKATFLSALPRPALSPTSLLPFAATLRSSSGPCCCLRLPSLVPS